MKDNGTVISVTQGLAKVEVACLQGCQGCAARGLCIGDEQSKGLITVQNPLEAAPGDEVLIHIPEHHYSRALIQLFGLLLAGLLLGMTAGYFSASVLGVSPALASFVGLLLGLLLSGAWLMRSFQAKNKRQLNPEIIDILKKGGRYEQA